MRLVALRTALIYSNWRSPVPKLKSFKILPPAGSERFPGQVLFLIPGTGLVVTRSLKEDCLQLVCWDVFDQKKVGEVEYSQTRCVPGRYPYLGVSGECTFPMIFETGELD